MVIFGLIGLAGSVAAVNSDECLMTRMQEMSLDYHFTVEQEVGSSTYAFFGFNGKISTPSFIFIFIIFFNELMMTMMMNG